MTPEELRATAGARLKDARTLLKQRRYDGAYYVCGYAVELALKSRLCRHLRWASFPESGRDWEDYKSLKTREPDVLLRFTGSEMRIKTKYLADWSIIKGWKPENRYSPVGTISESKASDMVAAASRIVRAL